MDKSRVPYIKRNLAESLERQSKYQQALSLYEASKVPENSIGEELKRQRTHNISCMAGISRTSILNGNIVKGIEIAKQLNDLDQVGEIAGCCEKMKHFEEAAELYEQAKMYERAATLYIAQKKFKKAESLVHNLTSPKILSSLAKVRSSV